jgi:hypothetical protein
MLSWALAWFGKHLALQPVWAGHLWLCATTYSLTRRDQRSNKMVDRYRRATRHPEIALETITETVCDDDASNPEHPALQQEAHSHLRQVIQRLPTLQQQILRLRYGDRLSFAEIGNCRRCTIRVFRMNRTWELSANSLPNPVCFQLRLVCKEKRSIKLLVRRTCAWEFIPLVFPHTTKCPGRDLWACSQQR